MDGYMHDIIAKVQGRPLKNSTSFDEEMSEEWLEKGPGSKGQAYVRLMPCVQVPETTHGGSREAAPHSWTLTSKCASSLHHRPHNYNVKESILQNLWTN